MQMKKGIALKYGAVCILIFLITVSCTFDYGETESSENDQPDLVMINVEYIRVRSSDPIARVYAERAERYEKKGVMKLENLTFEQYGEKGSEVNTMGSAGNASVDINSGDISMANGVRLEVESEDIIIETDQLDWKDETHILSTGKEDEVNIYRENGTHFIGIGLTADARHRTFEFSGDVSGTYIQEDDEADETDKLDKADETNKTEKQEAVKDE